MIPLRRALTLTLPWLLLTSCGVIGVGNGPNYAEADRQSNTLAIAISFPRQPDADGLARAVLATNLGKQSSVFSVLEATDLDHERPEEPMARLVWRIHHDQYDGSWGQHVAAWDACYLVEFNYYGPTKGPDRINCPADATPVTPPPTAWPNIPPGSTEALRAVLAALPAAPTEADVRTAVTAGLPAPEVDQTTGLADLPPDVLVTVKGTDVGVALFALAGVETKSCTLGNRVGGIVEVWGLSERDLGPREIPCTAKTALAGA